MKNFNKYLFLWLLTFASVVVLLTLNFKDNPAYDMSNSGKQTAGMDAIGSNFSTTMMLQSYQNNYIPASDYQPQLDYAIACARRAAYDCSHEMDSNIKADACAQRGTYGCSNEIMELNIKTEEVNSRKKSQEEIGYVIQVEDKTSCKSLGESAYNTTGDAICKCSKRYGFFGNLIWKCNARCGSGYVYNDSLEACVSKGGGGGACKGGKNCDFTQ